VKKLGVALIIIFVLFGCSSKRVSPVYTEGENLFKKYIDNYLKGKQVYEVYFDKTVNIFLRVDDFCNLSRVYLSRFLLNEEITDVTSLEKAKFFADTGNCSDEENIIDYLTGKKYNFNKLPVHYQKYIKYKNSKKIENMGNVLKDAPEYFTSRVLRETAVGLDGNDALTLIDEAYKIDTFNGWTLNIYRDLKMKRDILKNIKEDTSNIDIRINNLENILMIKK